VGTATGEVGLHDAYSGENMEVIDAHSSPVNLLQVRFMGCSLFQLWGASMRRILQIWGLFLVVVRLVYS
jgi:hypothetical protein